ncbi:hypothetical protein XELAEV_180302952mg, partial [Xenopus laevis]
MMPSNGPVLNTSNSPTETQALKGDAAVEENKSKEEKSDKGVSSKKSGRPGRKRKHSM